MRPFALGLSLASLVLAACSRPQPQANAAGQLGGADERGLLQVRGAELVDGAGQPIVLRGVAFGNEVWQGVAVPRSHHAEADYARVASMGMNSVRFYLNVVSFEDAQNPGQYKAEGWAWLDDNVRWARAHGIYLILNQHVPAGGFQSAGEGRALWKEPAMQQRFIDLWVAIAERYRDVPTVAGFDLLNEPGVTDWARQWHDLAARTVRAIRAVDPAHVLFVERVNSVGRDYAENPDRNFFTVADPNVVYEFHFYKPFGFTHQGASWAPSAPESAVYPDPEGVGLEWFNSSWKTASTSPSLPAGSSDWKRYEGAWFTVQDPELAVAQPALRCARVGAGKAQFDQVVLEERSAAGEVKERFRQNLNTQRGWVFWAQDQKGRAGPEAGGHEDNASLGITGTTAEAALVSDSLRFRLSEGTSYRFSGWMKGEAIPSGAECQLSLAFFSSKVPVHGLDRDFLAAELDAYVAWGRRREVPLYLGEWGSIRQSFEGNRGGLRWAEDMLDLIAERQLHFAFHDYHEDAMGLYWGEGELPSPERANLPLIELLTRKLKAASNAAAPGGVAADAGAPPPLVSPVWGPPAAAP
ncbi:MAG TPA: cellulase family glycosylhydrolase [Polyangiaceae bacterium]|nr:cellulase family glycosylhydrolase [Polyangiaceae bacterium]